MEDFIQQPPGQAPAQPQQAEMIPADSTPQPVAAGPEALTENPLTAPDEAASPEEQKQYDDLFMRVMQMVHDTREGPMGKSPADYVVSMLGDPRGGEAHEVIGKTAGWTMVAITDIAKRNGVEYDGRVLQEVGMDLVAEMIDIARVSGAIKGLPEDGSPQEEELMELSSLEAAKAYGEWLQGTGQADQQSHMEELTQQAQREADQGELDDWNMEEFDPKSRHLIAQKYGGFTSGA